MKYLLFVFGALLVCIGGWMMLTDTRDVLWWSLLDGTLLLIGGICINRALTNKPLLPSGPEAQQMMRNAREKSLLGTASIALFVLSVLFMELGTDNYFAYSQTYSWLTMIGVLALAGFGAYLLWRYLRFVKYGGCIPYDSQPIIPPSSGL